MQIQFPTENLTNCTWCSNSVRWDFFYLSAKIDQKSISNLL